MRTPDGYFLTEMKVNGQGPFYFVIDTAASNTAVTSALVDQLGVQPLQGSRGQLNGASGSGAVDTYRLDTLSGGLVDLAGVTEAARAS